MRLKNFSNYEIYPLIGKVWSYKSNRFIGCIDKNTGYWYVTLYDDNNKKSIWRLHRLIAQTFIPNPENKPCIDHINTDRTDNRVENLRWVTHKENCNNSITKNKMKKNSYFRNKFGIEHPNSKPVLQFTKEGKFIQKWDSGMDIQRELGFNQNHISSCCKGKRKTCGGFIWGYAEDYEKVKFNVFDLELYKKAA